MSLCCTLSILQHSLVDVTKSKERQGSTVCCECRQRSTTKQTHLVIRGMSLKEGKEAAEDVVKGGTLWQEKEKQEIVRQFVQEITTWENCQPADEAEKGGTAGDGRKTQSGGGIDSPPLVFLFGPKCNNVTTSHSLVKQKQQLVGFAVISYGIFLRLPRRLPKTIDRESLMFLSIRLAQSIAQTPQQEGAQFSCTFPTASAASHLLTKIVSCYKTKIAAGNACAQSNTTTSR